MEPIKLIPLVSGRAEEWSNGCEQFAVHLTYDMSAVLGVWPDAAPSVAFERADGEKYAHEFIVAENILHIPLTLADTAVAGACKCVVTMISQDGRANSDVYHGRVTVGIDTLDEEPTDPQLGIIEQVNGAAIRAEIAANDAERTLEEVVSAGEAKKQEIADAGAEQIENIQSSEMVKDLIKDAISEHFEENKITAEALGAAPAEALQNHEENKENPHEVTAEQVGAAREEAFNDHAENKENPHGVTAEQVKAAPSVHSSQHSADGSDPITPEAIEAAPSVHASQHGAGGSDPITPEAIGAFPTTGGTVDGNIVAASETAGRSFGCKVDTYDIRFMANPNGNRGLYDNATGEWLLKKDQYNDVVLYGFAKTVSSDAIKRATTSVTTSQIAKGSYLSQQTVSATTLTGYTPFAVIAVQSSSSYILPYYYMLNESSGKIGYSIRNLNTSEAVTPTLTFHVLYRRSTIAA